ncbi:hypothetical protein EIK77_002768 [Talaromyces pinophilus]|nr:hypothetical protein EIK77_002768 [Talaromyces pinophilus]
MQSQWLPCISRFVRGDCAAFAWNYLNRNDRESTKALSMCMKFDFNQDLDWVPNLVANERSAGYLLQDVSLPAYCGGNPAGMRIDKAARKWQS